MSSTLPSSSSLSSINPSADFDELAPEASAVTRSAKGKMRLAFRLLFWEGAFSMVYDTWTGPAYLSGLAGELHAPVIWVSLLCSAAWIGAVGQLVGAWVYERVPSYKHYTVGLAAASRAMWTLPIFMAAFWLYRQRVLDEPFPVQRWCALTSIVACVAALFGASSAAAWSSWMRALVPTRVRGKFFGERQRFVMVALIGANLAASFCVDWRPGGLYAGFALLGVLAVVAAGISVVLLGRVKDAGKPTGGGPAGVREFAQWIGQPLRNAQYRGLVIYGACFNGVMQLASPYFSYYFTRELGIPMSKIAFWAVLSNIGCLCAAAAWGRYMDRVDVNPRRVMRGMGSLVAISPAFYIPASLAWVKFVAPFDYFTNGAIWCGYWLAFTTMLYRSIPTGVSPALCFSIYTAAAGLCGAVGSLAGGRIAEWLMPWGGFRTLFLISSALRFASIWILYGLIRERLVRAAPQAEVPSVVELASRVGNFAAVSVAGGATHELSDFQDLQADGEIFESTLAAEAQVN